MEKTNNLDNFGVRARARERERERRNTGERQTALYIPVYINHAYRTRRMLDRHTERQPGKVEKDRQIDRDIQKEREEEDWQRQTQI